MSTRSQIAILNDDGSVATIYHHFDGYLDGVGKELITNYNSKELAIEAVTHSLGENISEADEQDVFESITEFEDWLPKTDREYAYIWADGEWKYIEVDWCAQPVREWKSVRKVLNERT